ncbi:MAG: radical SAM family heme chaperone HemW [Elusimicrobia bacterium]|nr:radical SAM family heme chaperone HemW [Elusimicrobiota bacterium]MDE2424697.1 radical SAM family heme chaperone HemW [Elusimicrobiota bacterium]
MARLAGLYVHIPFCSVKCFYCDFAAVAHHGHLAWRYLDALEREAALKPALKPATLYVGGGTPSELSAEQIESLYERLARVAAARDLIESTFEASPESLTREKLEALRRRGATRLSLGLQTADEGLLRAVGRRHGLRRFVEAYRAARALGGLAISVDLMYNLPGQSVRSCLDSLDFVLALEPDHLSLYGLQVEDRTLFGRRAVVADEDAGREMFERSLERLAAAGFEHYEISNFARPGRQSLHNRIYWEGGDYLGLGCGAASFLGGWRGANRDRLMDYLKEVEAGRDPVAERERLAGKEKLGEAFLLGLRLVGGFRPTGEMRAAFAPELDSLRRQGLIADAEDAVALTREGVFLGNRVFREFVPPFASAGAP